MILYNWKSILKSSNGNVNDIITILRIITYKITPKTITIKHLNLSKEVRWK